MIIDLFFSSLTQGQPEDLLRDNVSQSQRVKLRAWLCSDWACHGSDHIANYLSHIAIRVVNTHHPKAMIHQMNVQRLLLLALAIVAHEISRWTEVRTEVPINTQFIHNLNCLPLSKSTFIVILSCARSSLLAVAIAAARVWCCALIVETEKNGSSGNFREKRSGGERKKRKQVHMSERARERAK
jgi:hypothetical protein